MNKRDRKEYNKKYREKNRDKIKAYREKYRVKNREKIKAYDRKYYHENRKKLSKKRSEYNKTPKGSNVKRKRDKRDYQRQKILRLLKD